MTYRDWYSSPEDITPPSSSTLAVEEVMACCSDRCQPVRAALLFCVSNVIDRSTKKYFSFRRKIKLKGGVDLVFQKQKECAAPVTIVWAGGVSFGGAWWERRIDDLFFGDRGGGGTVDQMWVGGVLDRGQFLYIRPIFN